jgi:hypothetical protein
MSTITYYSITPTTSPEAMALLQTLLASGALQSVVPAGGSPAPTTVTQLTAAQDVIASIPVANDGDVIRSNYHNSLRDALIALLAEVAVGRGPVAPLAPALQRVSGSTGDWVVVPGVAYVAAPAAGRADAEGWLPVELPHGGSIQSLTVSGGRTGQMSGFDMKLLRRALTADPNPTTDVLAALDLSTANASFLISADVDAPLLNDPTPQQIADYRRIDNTKYLYYVTAEVTNARNGARAQLNSIQVVVSRV